MGVPTFYRWLSIRYPKVVKDAVEQKNVLHIDASSDESTFVPTDNNDPNPNRIEFDNLYIDMNGIIHPCCHPEDAAQPQGEEEMFLNVTLYIDRIVSIVRPRHLLFMAIDGVAPRAKMNQQRTRRFKAAADADLQEEIYEELKAEFAKDGRNFPAPSSPWDSNVITPGTPFMDRLARHLRSYVAKKMAEDTYWSKLRVILSDSNVPGEGEHKIVKFIRNQRVTAGYNPNTIHCLHGMDADLIMLGLATHETHFYIIREAVVENQKFGGPQVACSMCQSTSHELKDCPLVTKQGEQQVVKAEQPVETSWAVRSAVFEATWKPLQFLQIPVLREYLAIQLRFDESRLTVRTENGERKVISSDFERHLDDFILMCFFVGNDFLPHLPSLSINKGSIDLMLSLYCVLYPKIGGYLTRHGEINMPALKRFLSYVAELEPEILKADRDRQNYFKQQKEMNKAISNQDQARDAPPTRVPENPKKRVRPDSPARHPSRPINVDADLVLDLSDISDGEEDEPGLPTKISKVEYSFTQNIDKFKEMLSGKIKSLSEIKDPEDSICLGEGEPSRYRHKYYSNKFHLKFPPDNIETFAGTVARHYIQGMRWVLEYYYQGCCSWEWYYPFHYAPFACDLSKYGACDEVAEKPFEIGKPFRPFDQLMAVLPPRSNSCLPPALADMMVNKDSLILDFYPTKFKEDPDGKPFRWQWIVLLPFIEEKRLLRAVDSIMDTFTEEEKIRNGIGHELLFVSDRCEADFGGVTKIKPGDAVPLRGSVSGTVSEVPKHLTIQSSGKVSCVSIQTLEHPSRLPSRLLPGSIPVPPCVTVEDLSSQETQFGAKRFCGAAAKRMVLASIGRKHPGESFENHVVFAGVQRPQYQNYGQSNYQGLYHGGNAYQQRDFQSVPHQPYQPWARQLPEPPRHVWANRGQQYNPVQNNRHYDNESSRELRFQGYRRDGESNRGHRPYTNPGGQRFHSPPFNRQNDRYPYGQNRGR